MSTNQDLYTQLRELRKKILAMIKNLPDIAFQNISPEDLAVKSFLGRYRIGVSSYDKQIFLADLNSAGSKIDCAVRQRNILCNLEERWDG